MLLIVFVPSKEVGYTLTIIKILSKGKKSNFEKT